MAVFQMPYGDGNLELNLDGQKVAGVLRSRIHALKPAAAGAELVRQALRQPIGSPDLCELATGKRRVVIISSDHTRPVPSHIIMPQLLAEVRKGNPEAQITIIIATGCHRATTREEICEKYGADIADNEEFLIHNCETENLVHLGTLPSGGPLLVNGIVAEADLLIAEGFIEPHVSAGFSGGRKSVLPGIASFKSVISLHSGPILSNPKARTGVLDGNPVHADMLWAAKAAKLAFLCNVVLNEKKEIVYAVAGDLEQAHQAGCVFLKEYCAIEPILSDIVITTNGGYPLDQNIYQAVKGMTAAEATVRKNGVIIMLSESRDGHGSELFYNMFRKEKDLCRMLRTIENTPPTETKIDQWEAQILARILTHARVIYVSELPDEVVKEFQMIPAHSVEEAMATAEALIGDPDAQVTIIPDGVAVII